MVGGGDDDGQSGEIAHAAVRRQRLEGRHTLVVVHGQDGIELDEAVVAEERVGSIGAKGLDASLFQLVDGRLDNLLLLVAQQSAGTGMGVQGQHGDARRGDAHVAVQAVVQRRGFLHNLLLRDGFGHVLDGHVLRDQCHAEVLVDEHREGLRVTAEVVVGSGRSGDEDIGQTSLHVGLGALHGLAGSLLRLGRLLSHVHLHLVVGDRQEVQPSVLGIAGIGDVMELQLHLKHFTVVGSHLRCTIYNRCTQFQHRRVFECLEDDFISDTVGVAVRNGYANLFVLFHSCFSRYYVITLYRFGFYLVVLLSIAGRRRRRCPRRDWHG